MRHYRFEGGLAFVLAASAWAQQPTQPGKAQERNPPSRPTANQALKDALEPKVKAEWDALKARDKKAFSALLTDDFEAVEDDGDGARNKIHAANEAEHSNIHNYTMAFFDPIPLASNAAFVTYEVTMEFFPKAIVRYKRIYITEVWLRRDGEWKLRHYQETRVK